MHFHEVKPASRYERTVPSLIGFNSTTDDLARWFLKEITTRFQECPNEGIYEVKNCHIFHGKYVFLREAAEWLDYSVRDTTEHKAIEASFSIETLSSSMRDEQDDIDILTQKSCPRPYVHICKAGAGNYGHFLVEILPKLLILKQSGIDICTIILANESARFSSIVHAVAEILSIRADLHICGEGERLSGDFLSVSPISKHSKQKSRTLIEFRDILLGAFCGESASESSHQEALCITRYPNEKRAIRNQDRLDKYYRSLGATIVHPSDLSFKDQVRLFNSSRLVIGGLGAGMANIVFCKKYTEIIFATPGNADFFFWDLACLVGLEFTWIFANPLQHWSIDIENNSYSLDPALVKASIGLVKSRTENNT